MRGPLYRHANAAALQAKLAALGIAYSHEEALATPEEIQDIQKKADHEAGVGQTTRATLSDAFKDAYGQQVLSAWSVRDFVDSFPLDAIVVLFCVERAANACHRSLAASEIEKQTGQRISDITP